HPIRPVAAPTQSRALLIRIARWAMALAIPAPSSSVIAPATCGAANDVPLIAVKSGFDGGEFQAAEGAITAPAGAVRSGFLRPPGVGPRELTPRTTSSVGSIVPRSLNPPTVSTLRPMFPT